LFYSLFAFFEEQLRFCFIYCGGFSVVGFLIFGK